MTLRLGVGLESRENVVVILARAGRPDIDTLRSSSSAFCQSHRNKGMYSNVYSLGIVQARKYTTGHSTAICAPVGYTVICGVEFLCFSHGEKRKRQGEMERKEKDPMNTHTHIYIYNASLVGCSSLNNACRFY